MLFYIASFFSFVLCCGKLLQSCVTLGSPMDCSYQSPLSMGFPRQEYWSRLQCPPPGDLPDPGISNPHLYVSCFGRPVLYHQHDLGFCVISSNLCLLLCLHIFISFSIVFPVWFLSLIFLMCFCFMESFLHI